MDLTKWGRIRSSGVPAEAGTLADLRGYAAPIGLQSILHAVSFCAKLFGDSSGLQSFLHAISFRLSFLAILADWHFANNRG